MAKKKKVIPTYTVQYTSGNTAHSVEIQMPNGGDKQDVILKVRKMFGNISIKDVKLKTPPVTI